MNRDQRKKLEKQAQVNEEKIQKYLKADPHHKRPVSRRDFLRVGITNIALYAAAPSILTMLGKMGVAEAAECVATGTALSAAAYFNLNLSGGWSMAGNWVPYNSNNVPLTDYRTLGTAGVMQPTNTVTAFSNNARFYNTSATVGFLAGLRSIPNVDAQLARAVFVGLPAVSRDDTDTNRMDPSGLVARAGIAGSALPTLGLSESRTGIAQYGALGFNPSPPLRVTDINSIVRAVTFVNTSMGGLSAAQQQSLMRLVKNLSDSQARRLSSLSGGTEFADLIECGTGKNIQNLTNNLGNAVNVTQDPTFNALWTNAFSNGSNQLSGLVYNVLKGYAGIGGINFGGYDYHNGLDTANGINTFQQRRDLQNQQDFRVGQTVGRMILSAQQLNRKMFISLLSDGAVSADAGNPNDPALMGAAPNNFVAFTGDSGERGCLAFIAYDPSAAPGVSAQQIGAFSNDGTVDRTFVTGADIENAAVALFANWVKFSGDMTLFQKALPNSTRFDTNFLNRVIKIS